MEARSVTSSTTTSSTVSVDQIVQKVRLLASYCYGCNSCNLVCPTHLIGIFSPREFLNKIIHANLDEFDKVIAEGKLFNCLTCQQCSIYCPMTAADQGINFAELMQLIRSYAFQKGILQDDLAKHTTHDNLMHTIPKMQTESNTRVNSMDFLRNDPQLKIAKEGKIAFFVGCVEAMENIFYAYDIPYSKNAQSGIFLLNKIGITPVVLDTKCCGHDSYWAGDVETAKKLAEFNISQFKQAGVQTIIVECAEGYRMWKYDYPKLFPDCQFEVKHLSQVLHESKFNEKVNLRSPGKITVTYHDPCRLGRLGKGVYIPPRALLEGISGLEVVEMKNIKHDSLCCGVSTFRACNSDTHRIREIRVKEALETGANYLITTCPKCITHFQCYINETDDQGKINADAPKIVPIDLATFLARIYHANRG